MPISPSVALRPHDRVRPFARPAPTARIPFNIHDRLGFYWEADSPGGRIRVSRSDTATPPFVLQGFVTAGPGDSEPQIAFDAWDRANLVFSRRNGGDNTLRAFSDDDGATWSDPVSLFTGTKHPVDRETDVGTIIYAAWVISGGNITAREETAPEVFSDPWTFVDEAGGALVTDDDCFSFSQAREGAGRWVLVTTLFGNTVRYVSTDECRTWIQLG